MSDPATPTPPAADQPETVSNAATPAAPVHPAKQACLDALANGRKLRAGPTFDDLEALVNALFD